MDSPDTPQVLVLWWISSFSPISHYILSQKKHLLEMCLLTVLRHRDGLRQQLWRWSRVKLRSWALPRCSRALPLPRGPGAPATSPAPPRPRGSSGVCAMTVSVPRLLNLRGHWRVCSQHGYGESLLRKEQRGSSSPKSALHGGEAQRENMSFRLRKEILNPRLQSQQRGDKGGSSFRMYLAFAFLPSSCRSRVSCPAVFCVRVSRLEHSLMQKS